MLIKCPFCRTEARIPSSKEGAKVRCGECEKVYTARDPKARRSSGTQGSSIAIYFGAAVLAAVVFYFLNRSKGDPLPVTVRADTTAEQAPPEDLNGWNSAPVKLVRELYDAALSRNTIGLEGRLADASRAAASARILEPDPEDGDALALWKPFDGLVLTESDTDATVRIEVGGRTAETAAETRQLDFVLTRQGKDWRVVSWDRYLDFDQLEALAKSEREQSVELIERVELTDGTRVSESKPRAIEHLETTPEELRQRIDGLADRLVDFGLRPKENAAAKADLVEIGAPALPALLTALFELPLETNEDAMKVNLVNQALEEITGFRTGFRPQVDADSALGTTAERRESALRQWFAWWNREGSRFQSKGEAQDALEGLIQPTDRDLRQMERDAQSNGGDSR